MTGDAAASYFAAIKARRLLGLLRGEWWAIEGDDFDLVLACALMRGAAMRAVVAK